MDLQYNKQDIKKHLRERSERAAKKFRHDFERMFGKTFAQKPKKSTKFK